MGMADILAAKKQNKPVETVEKREISIFAEDILEDDLEPDSPTTGYYTNNRFLDNSKVDELFLAVLTPLVKNPYALYGIHFEYEMWLLLGDDHLHVLNSFVPIPEQVLFDAYMRYNPPVRTHHLHRLYVAISRIVLITPSVYLPKILELIKTASIKPLDNPGFFGYTDT